MPTTVVGGAKKPKTKKDTTCGVNPKTDRCKKGEPKGKDMCVLNKSTNRCKKDQHTEAKNYARIFKGGAATTRTARATSPVKGGGARATSPVRGGSARATSPVKGGARATSPVRGGRDVSQYVRRLNRMNLEKSPRAFHDCMNSNYMEHKNNYLRTRRMSDKRKMRIASNQCILKNHPYPNYRCHTLQRTACGHHRDPRKRTNCNREVHRTGCIGNPSI